MSRRFPLAGLMRLRHLEETQAAGRLQSARQDQQNTNQRLARFVETNTGGENPSSPAALLAIAAARSSSRSMLTELHALAAQAEQQVQDAESAYSQAKRATGVVEKLHQRHLQQQEVEELAREQSVLDEAAQRSHQYTAKGGSR
ncbi:flagellar FliJ family protein [Nesterenkonia massiliensis]|uniref:Flagellar FliJ protein n=1 Tax=Nesterenkonia massiliensis TaxID=1232429 RepID=A0ABT2HNZ2_9MICC|nr:flagellar FliJ family protein [Nesterenkonia massiliensis]MCT1606260.1 flagellar FliJ family protein [Nesterenkonia massiliensis]